MSRRVKINLILLAGIVLPPLSYLFMSFDLGMSIAALPFLGYVYPLCPSRSSSCCCATTSGAGSAGWRGCCRWWR